MFNEGQSVSTSSMHVELQLVGETKTLQERRNLLK